jgi:hypothetical protein
MTVNLSMLAGAGAQFFSDSGVPLSGGLIYTYAAGTTTPQATYTTSTGSTAHSNPIVLNSAGRVASGGEIWLTDAVSYKFVLQTSAAVTIATYDNVTGNASGVLSGIYAAFAASSGSSLVGYTQGGTGASTITVQTKLRQSINVADFGAVGDGTTNDTTAIQNAINAANTNGGGVVYFEAKDYLISNTLTLYSGISLIGAGSGQYPTLANVSSVNFIALNKTRILASASFPTTTPMLSVITPNSAYYGLQSVSVQGIMLDCANVANYGIKSVTVKHSFFKDILVFRPTVYGIWEDCLPSTVSGTAQAGGASTITLQATAAVTRDSWYNGLTITTTGGTGSGQTRTISSYVGSTQVATVSSAWTTAPDATTTYTITGVGPSETNAATQFNEWTQVTVWAGDNPSSATGWIMNGDTVSNVNQNTYDAIKIVVRDGDAMIFANADANTMQSLSTYNFASTGTGVRFKGNEKNLSQFARFNTIVWCQLTGPGGIGGLIAESGTSVSSYGNVASVYSTGNSAPQPTIQTGAEFWYNTDRFFPYTWIQFTPTITFATPGDLSVAYTVQNGRYWKVGPVVNFQISISFTPTFTTASGVVRVSGLPIKSNNLTTGYQVTCVNSGVGLTYPAGTTSLTGRVMNGLTYIQIVGSGSSVANAFIQASNFASGSAYILLIGGSYESFV